MNAFEISNLQEQETESRYPGDPDVTMLHGAEKLLNGVFADHQVVGALPTEIRQLSIASMVKENVTWGEERIALRTPQIRAVEFLD